jgi:hypothetical protein
LDIRLSGGLYQFGLYECVRGDHWYIANLICSVALNSACLVVIALSFASIYCMVRTTEKRTAQFSRQVVNRQSSAVDRVLTRSTARQAFL